MTRVNRKKNKEKSTRASNVNPERLLLSPGINGRLREAVARRRVRLSKMDGEEKPFEFRCVSCGEEAKPSDRSVAEVPEGCDVSVQEALTLNAGIVKASGVACERCFELVGRLQRADQCRRQLRDQLISLCRGKTPSDGISDRVATLSRSTQTDDASDNGVVFEASATLTNIKTETPDEIAASFTPLHFSDSDDEPLFKTKLNAMLQHATDQIKDHDHLENNRNDDDVEDFAIVKVERKSKSRKSESKQTKKFRERDAEVCELANKLKKKLSSAGLTIKKVPYKSFVSSSNSIKREKNDRPESPETVSSQLSENTTELDYKPFREKRKYNKKRRVSCSECPAQFTSAARLQVHMAKHEESRGPYICEICGAAYKHKKACDIHVDMHKGVSPWKCSQCGKIFPSKGALSRHEAIHTGTPNYQCDLCGKSFIHTSSFKMHKLSHSGIKPHTCNKCGLSLMTKSHLKRHQRVHSGEKRHECETCGKKFSERYNLYAHQKSHEYSSAHRQSKHHTCNLCDSTFLRRHLLEKHMQTAHQLVSENKHKHPRNTMNKVLKQQTQSSIIDPTLIKPEVILLEARPPDPVSPKANQSLPNTATSITLKSETPYTSTSEEKPGDQTPHSQVEPINGITHPWQLMNYQLANDYPLRMHGVDYAGYLNRQ